MLSHNCTYEYLVDNQKTLNKNLIKTVEHKINYI